MKPHDLQTQLVGAADVPAWKRDETVKRWRWAVDSYCDGYISREYLDEERGLFEDRAESLLAQARLITALRRASEARDNCFRCGRIANAQSPGDRLDGPEFVQSTTGLCWACDRVTRIEGPEWAQRETAKRERERQVRKLREGAATLASLRRLLRGADPLPPPAFRPARTSQTS